MAKANIIRWLLVIALLATLVLGTYVVLVSLPHRYPGVACNCMGTVESCRPVYAACYATQTAYSSSLHWPWAP